jgi:hypothetical protein
MYFYPYILAATFHPGPPSKVTMSAPGAGRRRVVRPRLLSAAAPYSPSLPAVVAVETVTAVVSVAVVIKASRMMPSVV